MTTKKEIFQKIPIFGMIHLAGTSPIKRALEEISLFEEESLDGVIVENYHSRSVVAVIDTLEEIRKLNLKILLGVNILPNDFEWAFTIAQGYDADFIQLDHVAGIYGTDTTLNLPFYDAFRHEYPEILVLGGVWSKYYQPVKNSNLETDLREGMQRADAIAVTGAGTGKETPLEKIQQFRAILGDHPLIVGAGLTPQNAYQQLSIADGAIVGTCLKRYDRTENEVDRARVKEFMSVVTKVRKYRGVPEQ